MVSLKEASGRYRDAIEYFFELYVLLYTAFKNFPYLKITPIRSVFLRQIYFAGEETFWKMIVIGILVGIVIITQITNLVGLSSAFLTARIMVWVVVRERGPLLAAIIIISRSVTAVSADRGSMHVQGEIESLELMGIDYNRYLIMPRVFALTLSSVVLTFYFEFAAIFGGITLTSLFWGVPFEEFAKGLLQTLSVKGVSVSLIKSVLFGFVIGVVSCSQGLKVSKSITRIPQAITKATMQSLFLVFIFDGIITFIFYI